MNHGTSLLFRPGTLPRCHSDVARVARPFDATRRVSNEMAVSSVAIAKIPIGTWVTEQEGEIPTAPRWGSRGRPILLWRGLPRQWRLAMAAAVCAGLATHSRPALPTAG